MSATDRIIRMIITGILASLYFANLIPGMAAIGLKALTIIFALTSLAGSCPMYELTGIRTLKMKKVSKK